MMCLQFINSTPDLYTIQVEMEQKSRRMEHEFNVVCDQRISLSAILSQLLEEKEKRQAELKKRLIEMEQQVGVVFTELK